MWVLLAATNVQAGGEKDIVTEQAGQPTVASEVRVERRMKEEELKDQDTLEDQAAGSSPAAAQAAPAQESREATLAARQAEKGPVFQQHTTQAQQIHRVIQPQGFACQRIRRTHHRRRHLPAELQSRGGVPAAIGGRQKLSLQQVVKRPGGPCVQKRGQLRRLRKRDAIFRVGGGQQVAAGGMTRSDRFRDRIFGDSGLEREMPVLVIRVDTLA